jgi:ssDNA-binding Zn-finger/Zn-ribbon topoisomerase 1
MIEHFPTCRATYPEKPEDELPQQIAEIELDEGDVVLQCVDCGAYKVVKRNQRT